MYWTDLQALTQQAAAILSRRASLIALGGAALGAAATPGAGWAKKGKQKCGKKCDQRCRKQQQACLTGVDVFCANEGDVGACIAACAPCCDDLLAACNVEPAAICLMSCAALA